MAEKTEKVILRDRSILQVKEINLDYQLYLQREEQFYHQSYENEVEYYSAIQKGDLEFVEKCRLERESQEEEPLAEKGIGVMSRDPVKNERYRLIANAAIIARKCIESGMMQEVAYTLCDLYIQQADEADNIRDLQEIDSQMVREFTSRMHNLHFRQNVSNHVSKCLLYIYEHLYEQITLEKLANMVKLTPSYLSYLFKKETGITVHRFIQERRLETAKNLLKQQEYSCMDIAAMLCFSSQSHFIKSFKEKYGITPKEYRMRNHYKFAIRQSRSV